MTVLALLSGHQCSKVLSHSGFEIVCTDIYIIDDVVLITK